MSEADTRENLVVPKLKDSGWKRTQIEREFPIRKKRYYINGEDYIPIEPPKKFADIVLKVNNVIVGVVEVKEEHHRAEEGFKQAKDYAERLNVPISYATNGHTIIVYDRRTLEEKPVDNFLGPNELYQIYKEWRGLENVNISPLEYLEYINPEYEKRAYQETAVKNVIEAIVKGQRKVLLTMATGTGKTYVSFQIVWKFIKSGYFTRVLFLADRTFLRDQAYEKYKPFKKARSKILGNTYAKNRKIYFSTYQTLYGNDLYKKIPRDFFDLIIIDECHRSRYGDWGAILDHFNTAYHLGMTATPRREDNIDVYDYFGKPVFEYSMGKAIEDGYLVPYKIYRILTNVDKNGLLLDPTMEVVYDDEIQLDKLKKVYYQPQFEREISLPERTKLMCKELKKIYERTGDYSKTIVFCVDIEHAEQVESTLNELMDREDFATEIVSEDKDDLPVFRDGERKFPVVATTVDLLSTGIDIPPLKNIVFMRPVGSTVLFKQIIGRGSRLSKNKGFFRIIDFTNATRLIDGWDVPSGGKGLQIENPEAPFDKQLTGFVVDAYTNDRIENARVKVKVGRFEKLTFTDEKGFFILNELPSNETVKVIITKDGYTMFTRRVETNNEMPLTFELKSQGRKQRKIVIEGIHITLAEKVEIELNGTSISKAEYKKYIKDNVLSAVHSLDELKNIWLNDKKRKDFLKRLAEKNARIEVLKYLDNMNDVDSFDIIAHLVFNAPLLSTNERVKMFFNLHSQEVEKFDDREREIVFSILEKYKRDGIDNLTPDVLNNADMREKNALKVLKNILGLQGIRPFFETLKSALYGNYFSA